MGYITRQRIYPAEEKSHIPQRMSSHTRTEIEYHYYCDQCGSWDVIPVETSPGVELALGCAKYLVLGLLLSALVFWPLLILALVFLVGIIVYERRTKAKETDVHRCNQCGLVWDQETLSDPNPRGYDYSDYVASEYGYK